MNEDFQNFLQKVGEFTNIALDEIGDLKTQVRQQRVKEAAIQQNAEKRAQALEKALMKAAQALYESDFITDDTERKEFLKSAKENPVFIANMLEKVCKAADVSLIGIPARVAIRKKTAEFDPVMARAFGLDNTSSHVFLDGE
jgi:hypothetical protein